MSESLVGRLAVLAGGPATGAWTAGTSAAGQSGTPVETSDGVGQRLCLLEQAADALKTTSASAALTILTDLDPVSGPHAPTIEWGTDLLRSVCDLDTGDFLRAADELSRLVELGGSLPDVAWEFPKVLLARAYGRLGRHEDELTLLAEVMQNRQPDPHDLALAHEQLAICLDRYCLGELAWEQWQLGLASLPRSEASTYVRQLAGLVRSGLNRDGPAPADLSIYVEELKLCVDGESVWPVSRAHAGVALAQWHASLDEWAIAAEHCVVYGPLVRQHCHAAHPVAIVSSTLEAELLVADGRHQEAISLLEKVDLELVPERSAEALLRTLVTAQRTCGEWGGVARTNERLDSFVMAARKNRRRIAYHSQLGQIEALQRSETALVEALSERDGVVTIVGHELRSPLAQIGLELDRCRVERSDGSLHPPEVVIRSYERLRSIVDDVSLVGLIESSAVEVRSHEVDLAVPVERAIESAIAGIQRANLVIDWQSPTEPVRWPTDELWVERIVSCLLESTIQSCQPLDVISICISSSEHLAEIVIKDSGSEIANANLDHPTSPMDRLGSQTSDGGRLSRLDWYLAKRLAGLLGGMIEVGPDHPGSSAKYTLSIPAPRYV